MVEIAHHFFITICVASDSGEMEVIMKKEKKTATDNQWCEHYNINNGDSTSKNKKLKSETNNQWTNSIKNSK